MIYQGITNRRLEYEALVDVHWRVHKEPSGQWSTGRLAPVS